MPKILNHILPKRPNPLYLDKVLKARIGTDFVEFFIKHSSKFGTRFVNKVAEILLFCGIIYTSFLHFRTYC